MRKMTYEIITKIKESEKGSVCLAAVQGYGFPLIVKQMKHGNEVVLQKLKEIDDIHIPKLYHYEKTEDGVLIFEEYIEGELLSDYLRNNVLTDEVQLKLAIQLCEALETLHAVEPPLIHRDVKPSNIIINSKGVLKLIDYDAARIFKEDVEGDTRLLGTEHYAPPEQYGFSQTDQRSDIYSLGVVLGKFPQLSSEKKQKVWKKIVERCTLFDPDSRFQQVSTVKTELQNVMEGKRLWGWKIVCAAIVLALGFGGIVYVMTSGSEENVLEENLNATPLVSKQQAPESEKTTAPTPNATPEPTEMMSPAPSTGSAFDVGWTAVADRVFADDSEEILRPEDRVLETDSDRIKALKQEIQSAWMVVSYYFKDRMQEKPYLTYVSFFEDKNTVIQNVCLTSCETGKSEWLNDATFCMKDNMLHISGEYMNALEDGYYRLDVEMHYGEERRSIGWGIVIYVSQSDDWRTTDNFLWNNYFDIEKEKEQQLHFLLCNDVEDRIDSLIWVGQGVVDPELYEILYDGRAIALSEELVSRCCQFDRTLLGVETENGLYQQVTLTTN